MSDVKIYFGGFVWLCLGGAVGYFAYVAFLDREARERWRRRELANPFRPLFSGAEDPMWHAVSTRIFATVFLVLYVVFLISWLRKGG